MLLTVDCGNTHIVLGLYETDQLISYWRISTDAKRTEDEYFALLKNLLLDRQIAMADIDGFIVSSVVPAVSFSLQKFAEKYLPFEPFFVDHDTNTGIKILTDNPLEVGADRIVNALAAHKIYGGTLIVVDFGTATTFDCVSAAGEYLGGAIAPGLEVSLNALFARAAKLTNISLEKPEHAIGKSTAESLRSGILWGYGGMVDGLVKRMSCELPDKPLVIGTGGLAQLISDYSDSIVKVDNLLTLEGLRMIWQMHC